MNGKAMIINQAVIAFCKHVCGAELRPEGSMTPKHPDESWEVMYRAW
jgi:hypothetical protein